MCATRTDHMPGNKNEEQCREILQRLTGKKFNSVRPDFLKNPETNRNLELDMYCEEMNVAFEYNGCQHYHFIPGGFLSSPWRDRLQEPTKKR